MERAEQVAHLVEALRTYVDEAGRTGAAFAREQGMHRTDGAALLAVLRAERAGEPLTPGRLGAALELSSGATTAVLDRLERLGHLHRERDHGDRRRVTLHHADAGAEAGRSWFGPLGRRIDTALAGWDDDELALAGRFLELMTDAVVAHRRGDPL